MNADDATRLRERQDDADDAATLRDAGADLGSPTIVGKTVAIGTYPTAAASTYGITPQVVLGAEAEGSAGTLAASAGTFKALNLGAGVPPAGTTVICRFVPYRWVFRYG